MLRCEMELIVYYRRPLNHVVKAGTGPILDYFTFSDLSPLCCYILNSVL